MEYTITSFLPVIPASVSGAVSTPLVFGSETGFYRSWLLPAW